VHEDRLGLNVALPLGDTRQRHGAPLHQEVVERDLERASLFAGSVLLPARRRARLGELRVDLLAELRESPASTSIDR